MDLNGLNWTKNVTPIDGEIWAYENINTTALASVMRYNKLKYKYL
ncbi:hypothetical protein [Nostoc sp.]